MTLKAVYSSCD